MAKDKPIFIRNLLRLGNLGSQGLNRFFHVVKCLIEKLIYMHEKFNASGSERQRSAAQLGVTLTILLTNFWAFAHFRQHLAINFELFRSLL